MPENLAKTSTQMGLAKVINDGCAAWPVYKCSCTESNVSNIHKKFISSILYNLKVKKILAKLN